MLELAGPLLDALRRGRPLAVATVVGIDGSAPRELGTSMAWDGERVIGSVAGGCVEGALVDALGDVLADGETRELEFGVPDEGTELEQALAVGLSCGGRLRIHLALLRPDDPAIAALERAATDQVARISLSPRGIELADCPDGFVDEIRPPARMIITGAMAFTQALSTAAQLIGYRVTVLDPRPVFATPERFPGAEVVVEWPPQYLEQEGARLTERDAVCLLSHDDRYDSEALLLAVRSRAFYVGAMGSRRTDARRRERMRELGATEDELARLHAPIGLDLGATTAEETAISILAELIREREGATGASLRERDGFIHARAASAR